MRLSNTPCSVQMGSMTKERDTQRLKSRSRGEWKAHSKRRDLYLKTQ